MKTLTIDDLIARRDVLFVINHSGGKDSQAQMIEVLKRVPASRALVVHATLGRIEHHGALELAQKQAADANVPFEVAQAIWADGSPKDFIGMVRDRKAKRPDAPSFPSSSCRQCTSDLKRGPIEKVIKAFMKAHGYKLVVNVIGIRAAESTEREKLIPFVYLNADLNKKGQPKSGLAKAGRHAWSWFPIFDYTTEQVFATIKAAGQEPHWAYKSGNERLSCVFCIMGKKSDIANGARHRPELFAELSSLEKEVGYTLHMSRKPLDQLVAEAEAEVSKLAA